jgi:hypothetical protein
VRVLTVKRGCYWQGRVFGRPPFILFLSLTAGGGVSRQARSSSPRTGERGNGLTTTALQSSHLSHVFLPLPSFPPLLALIHHLA